MNDGFGGYDDQPVFAEFYDHVPAYKARPDVGFYIDLASASGGRTLELGCGTGRILIPMAQAGLSVTGLDRSEKMLARCKSKIDMLPRDAQDNVRIVQDSMTGFDLKETFDLITTPFRSFQHLVSVDDQLACLRQVRRHLAEGGTFVLETFQVNFSYLTDSKFAEETEDFSDEPLPGGRTLKRAFKINEIHRAEQFNVVELIYYVTHPDGRTDRFVQAFPFRYFFRYEVEHLLSLCGFKVIEIYGNFDKTPLQDHSPEMIFLAAKM